MQTKTNQLKDWFHHSRAWNSWSRVIHRGGPAGTTLEITVGGGPNEGAIKLREHGTICNNRDFHHHYPVELEEKFLEKHGAPLTYLVFHADLASFVDMEKFYQLHHAEDYMGGGIELSKIMNDTPATFTVASHLNNEIFTKYGKTLEYRDGQENHFSDILDRLQYEVVPGRHYYGGLLYAVSANTLLILCYRDPGQDEITIEFVGYCGLTGVHDLGMKVTFGVTELLSEQFDYNTYVDMAKLFALDLFKCELGTSWITACIIGIATTASRRICCQEAFLTPPLEIERKWLIPSWNSKLAKLVISRALIEQFYDDDGVRYRRTYDGTHFNFIKTIKSGDGLVRPEYELGISHEAYYNAKARVMGNHPELTLNKQRMKVPLGDLTIEVDVFERGDIGAVAEIEFANEELANAFTDVPDWFGVEVTGSKYHSNFALFYRNQIGKRLPELGRIEIMDLSSIMAMPVEK